MRSSFRKAAAVSRFWIPKGAVGAAELRVIVEVFALMLVVVVPVLVMTFWFAWKYRESNEDASYAPKWNRSRTIEWIVWLVPSVLIAALSVIVWNSTHQLDPYKPLDAAVKPVRVEVIALDWKWLFIYPDRKVAAVNQVVFPANVPVSFRVTSDTVMTSFFIPRLGSQIYAMAGMQTRLNLIAHETGAYAGQNQQFSGLGYSDMNFEALAVTPEEFEKWVQKAGQSTDTLDLVRYEQLGEPGVQVPVSYFSPVRSGLFDHVMGKYAPEMEHCSMMNHQPANQ